MSYRKAYDAWLKSSTIDEKSKEEVLAITDQKDLEDRFGSELKFGTAGVRGIVGAGTNRMNAYTVGRVCQAHAEILKEEDKTSVLVAYDVRNSSEDFARLISEIFLANGLKVYISDGPLATPIASFAIRELGLDAGVVVTASHNPSNYNGYKAFAANGGQIQDDFARKIEKRQEDLNFSDIRLIEPGDGKAKLKAKHIPDKVYQDYIKRIDSLKINDDFDKEISIVYSALNGTGIGPVRDILSLRNFENLSYVKDQVFHDGNFDGITYPNPEFGHVFEKAIELGKDKKADILLATDPDADRLGLMVWHKGAYVQLGGNELGPLLVDYILKEKSKRQSLGTDPYIVKTVVTGDLAARIAEKYSAQCYETLTGYKNISQLMERKASLNKSFIFAFEEAIGYLCEDFIRDKDGISAAMMVAEMAGYYKEKEKSLVDVLEDLYKEYGYFINKQISIELDSFQGQDQVQKIMDDFRVNPVKRIGQVELSKFIDFNQGFEGLSKTNLIKFYYDDSWIAIRPSGTEAKLKFYINLTGPSKENLSTDLEELEKEIRNKIK